MKEMNYFDRLIAANIPPDDAAAIVSFFSASPELLDHIVMICESCAEVA